MSDPFLSMNIAGIDRVTQKLDKLPPAVADAGVESANGYLIDALKNEPTQVSIPWAQVGGPASGGFYTERQRRFVMAALHDGSMQVPYSRTQNMINAWHTEGSGKEQTVTNSSPIAQYVIGSAQARRPYMAGWNTAADTLRKNMRGVLLWFSKGVNAAIKDLGLD